MLLQETSVILPNTRVWKPELPTGVAVTVSRCLVGGGGPPTLSFVAFAGFTLCSLTLRTKCVGTDKELTIC